MVFSCVKEGNVLTMLSMAMVLWLSSVFSPLGWLPPKPFHSFLTHGNENKVKPQLGTSSVNWLQPLAVRGNLVEVVQ